ncbi:MAG: hypothetical protein ABL894_09360 [Hyphomicrobium sp.]
MAHSSVIQSCVSALIERPDGGEPAPGAPVRYTIASLINDAAQYAQMRASFRAGGFTPDDCEFLFIDNSHQNRACAYRGLDAMLSVARGEIVILCHQDVRLLSDDRETLDARLAGLTSTDPDWALAGNAGGVSPGHLALRITDPHGAGQNRGSLPARVISLDENFIAVRRMARIGFSRDLSGFHFYGADICLNAAMAGYRAYVIDFHLAHLSAGNKNASFDQAREAFAKKWSSALAPRWMQTTCALVRLSGGKLGRMAGHFAARPLASIQRRRVMTAGGGRGA